MPIFDGVVTIDDHDVKVILGVEDETIRLSSGGREIGEWDTDECEIAAVEEGIFTITVENETLRFSPNNPSTFAAALNGGRVPMPAPTASDGITDATGREETTPAAHPEDGDELPAPRPVTMVVFYALAAVTAVLGLWALITILL